MTLTLQAIKKRVGNRLRDGAEIRSRRELEQRGYLDFAKKRPPDAFPPDAADLWYLYRLVRTHKPLVILEFGSGCSTAVLTQALFDNGAESGGRVGHLYSLDTVEYWAGVTETSMPKHLAGFYEIRTAPTARNGTERGIHHLQPAGHVCISDIRAAESVCNLWETISHQEAS